MNFIAQSTTTASQPTLVQIVADAVVVDPDAVVVDPDAVVVDRIVSCLLQWQKTSKLC